MIDNPWQTMAAPHLHFLIQQQQSLLVLSKLGYARDETPMSQRTQIKNIQWKRENKGRKGK
jgi:hypothetical protein